MLKIAKNEFINDNDIEAICLYGTRPLVRFASEANKNNMQRRFVGKYGLKSIFIMKNGFVFIGPYTPETYISRLDGELFLQTDRKKYYIRTSEIREICTKLSAGQRREVVSAKETGRYFKLSGNKKTRYYIFTVSGRIYGVQSIPNVDEA